MKTILVFPGQASQYVGMAKELYEAHPEARQFIDRAEEILEMPLKRLMFEGPEAELTDTANAQPAIVAASLAAFLVYEGEFHMTAGHSLGEYSALAAAGAISFEDALRLVKVRGQLMAQAGERSPGTMAAVIGMEIEKIEEVLKEVPGTVIVANYNSPGQVVISGEIEAIKRASELLKERGAKRVIPLKVSAAFHSPLMAEAAEAMKEEIERVEFSEPKVSVIPCATARPTKDPAELKEALKRQLLAPVNWVKMMEAARAEGVERFVEVGPGKVLQGLIKRIFSDAKIEGFGS